jgi:hypothetical protein
VLFVHTVTVDATIVPTTGMTSQPVPRQGGPAASLLFQSSVTLMSTLLGFCPSLASVLHENGVLPLLVRSFAAATNVIADLFEATAVCWDATCTGVPALRGTPVQVWAAPCCGFLFRLNDFEIVPGLSFRCADARFVDSYLFCVDVRADLAASL